MSKIGKGSSLLKEQVSIRCIIREFETCLMGQSQTSRSRSDHVRFPPDSDRIADITHVGDGPAADIFFLVSKSARQSIGHIKD
jgi:hypothetical protein